MTEIKEHFSLKHLNTFGIDATARYFAKTASEEETKDFFGKGKYSPHPLLLIGKGSNILFTGDFEGLVLQPAIEGIRVIEENEDFVRVEAGAGVEWDCFVQWCVNNGYAGVENLSLIPGSTGCAPIQNIGAYGAEAKDVIESVRYIDTENLQNRSIPAEECRFGYRTSIFKEEMKNRAVVTGVIFNLSKRPRFNTSYGNLREEVEKAGGPTLENVREAVISIRRSRLPDPCELGNAGSFFKNPVVDSSLAESLKKSFPRMPVYPAGKGKTKIAAGWLIEQCGWKGRRCGDAGVHSKQALVLVNHGNASGRQIYDLAMQISSSVEQKFSLKLEPEVVII